MTDFGDSERLEPVDSSSWTRTASTSETIRKRVHQLLVANGTKVNHLAPPTSLANNTSTHTRSDTKDSPAPAASSSHSLKRKKLTRTEKKSGDGVLDSPLHSNKKGKTLVPKHPYHPTQENRCYEGSSDEYASKKPIATSEWDRMQKEVEALRAALHESKKTTKRQSKKMEDMKVELNSAIQALRDKDLELTALKTKYTKKEELVSIIESSVYCQICMDLPDKPFALAPCGHVLCLTCLQEWFRKAPPTLDDMDIDPEELTDPHYILMRSKTCPSCRTVVRHRPVPVFMVKAVASVLHKAKASSYSRSLHERHSEKSDDPWKGIFPSSDEEQEEEDDDSSGDSDSDFDVNDFRTTIYWYRRRAVRRALYRDMFTTAISDDDDEDNDSEEDIDIASESGDEVVENIRYVRPCWAPPSVYIDPEDFNLADEPDPVIALKLLQRGCTWEMMENHELSYDHSSGIVLCLRSLDHLYASDDEGEAGIDGRNRIYLGWNVVLASDDIDGERFINGILQDIKGSPSRWESTPRPGMPGYMDVRRLVPVDEAANYNTTDSEAWNETDDF